MSLAEGEIVMNFSDVLQSADWKSEKHVPMIEAPKTVKKNEVTTIAVSVGKEVSHPNTTEHHIRWIRLYFKPEGGKNPFDLGLFEFNAHGESVDGANQGPVYSNPVATIQVKLSVSGTFLASSYCNIHGLWESSCDIKVED